MDNKIVWLPIGIVILMLILFLILVAFNNTVSEPLRHHLVVVCESQRYQCNVYDVMNNHFMAAWQCDRTIRRNQIDEYIQCLESAGVFVVETEAMETQAP